MASVTGMTAARMQAIEDESIVNGAIVSGHLILSRHDGTTIDSGSVIGPSGPTGPAGATSIVVCTSTTRPTGGALFNGLAIYETDTKRVYLWDGAAWNYRGGLWICTSTTRPASPFNGLMIYETNTKFLFVYDGTTYNYRGGMIVCTSTTRPASPFNGLAIYETDTTLTYIYDGTTWNYRGGTIICTSTTHPASPIKGLSIYETDTDKHLIWNGLRFDPPWNLPWGFVAEANPTGADQTGLGTAITDITGASVTLSASHPSNRKLKISAIMNAKANNAGSLITGYIRDGSNNNLKRFYQDIQNGTTAGEEGFGFVTHSPAAGVFTYKLSALFSIAGEGSVFRAAAEYAPHILVEDMGPNGAPA